MPCLCSLIFLSTGLTHYLILNEWAETVLNSKIGKEYFAGASKQTTNLASINMTQLRSFPFPIPPKKEQEIILNRLKSLMEYCDTLETRLRKARSIAQKLSHSAVVAISLQGSALSTLKL